MNRSVSVLAVPLAALAAAATTGAAAAASPSGAGAAFSGNCSLAGMVSFAPPITVAPQPVTSVADATGTCSGTLTRPDGTSRSLNQAAARYHAQEFGSSVSCGAGLDSGSGTLTVADVAFPFAVVEHRITGAALLQFTGDGGGSAVGDAAVAPGANQQGILTACAGSGLAGAPIDASVQTTQPLQSSGGSAHDVKSHPDTGRRSGSDMTAADSASAPTLTSLPLTSPESSVSPVTVCVVALLGAGAVGRWLRRLRR